MVDRSLRDESISQLAGSAGSVVTTALAMLTDQRIRAGYGWDPWLSWLVCCVDAARTWLRICWCDLSPQRI